MRSTADRLRTAVGMVVSVVVIGTIGFRILGLGWLDSVYMTIISITTVGFTMVRASASFFLYLEP